MIETQIEIDYKDKESFLAIFPQTDGWTDILTLLLRCMEAPSCLGFFLVHTRDWRMVRLSLETHRSLALSRSAQVRPLFDQKLVWGKI